MGIVLAAFRSKKQKVSHSIVLERHITMESAFRYLWFSRTSELLELDFVAP